MGNVLAVLEQRAGKIRRVSLESLAAARQVAGSGGQVDALLIGGAATPELGAFGADRVFVVNDERLALYQPSDYAALVAGRAREGSYQAIIVGATALGRDLGPRVAARLALPLLADVTAISPQDGIVVNRPAYSGKAIV